MKIPWKKLWSMVFPKSWIKTQAEKSRKQEIECIVNTLENHINKEQFKLTDNEKMVVVSQLYDRLWKKAYLIADIDEYERALGFRK